MLRPLARAMIRNLIGTAVVVLPITLVVFASIQSVRGEDVATSVPNAIGELGILYLAVIGPTALGVALYTACLLFIAARTPTVHRLAAMAMTPVVLLPWLAFPIRRALVSGPFLASLIMGLVILGAIAAHGTRRDRKAGAGRG